MIFAPIALSAKFPLVGDIAYAQGDAPITWLHRHNCLELGYCYEGTGVFVIGKKVIPFQTGAVSIIGPAEFHLARSASGTKSKWTWVYLDPVRLLQAAVADSDHIGKAVLADNGFHHILGADLDPLVGILMRQLITEIRENKRDSQAAIRGLVWSLMIRFNRLVPHRNRKPAHDTNRAIPRIAPALDLMASRYSDTLATGVMARSCHLSTTHFRRLFLRALGRSPHRYLMELRVRLAATRLQASNEKIIVVAQDVGFSTVSSFNRAFRQIMKVTPRQWRNLRQS